MSDDIRGLMDAERRALLWLLGVGLSDAARKQVLAWAAKDQLRSGLSPLRWDALQCWVAGEVLPGVGPGWRVHDHDDVVEGSWSICGTHRLVSLRCVRVTVAEIEEEVTREKEREAWLAFLAGTNPGAHLIQQETKR